MSDTTIDTAAARTQAEIDAEGAAVAELLASLFGIVPTAADPDYLDSGEPTTEQYPHSLTTGKIVANAGRVMVVLSTHDGTDLVYDFRLEDGEIKAHRADEVAPKQYTYTEPTTKEVTDAESFSVMYDDDAISILVGAKDGVKHGMGFTVRNGKVENQLDYTVDADGNWTGTVFGTNL